MRWWFVLGILALSGCLDGGGQDVPAPRPQTKWNPLAVDLHTHLVSLTLPPDQPTAFVFLNVTKDMWIRAPTTIEGLATGTEETDYWQLCIDTTTRGLPEDLALEWFPFRTDGEHLVLHGKYDSRSNGEGWPCVSGYNSQTRIVAFRAAQPTDGIVGLLMTAVPILQAVPQKGEDLRTPAFTVTVGISTQRCDERANSPGGVWYCGVTDEAEAEPTILGGPASKAIYLPHEGCRDCGFEVEEPPLVVAGAGPGTASAHREFPDTPGLSWLAIVAGVNPANLQGSIKADGESTAASCLGPGGNTWIWMLRSHAGTADVRAQTTHVAGSAMMALDIPIDMRPTGFEVEPYVWAGAGVVANPNPWPGEDNNLCL